MLKNLFDIVLAFIIQTVFYLKIHQTNIFFKILPIKFPFTKGFSLVICDAVQ